MKTHISNETERQHRHIICIKIMLVAFLNSRKNIARLFILEPMYKIKEETVTGNSFQLYFVTVNEKVDPILLQASFENM